MRERVKHYGDICRMSGAEVERVECVIGGSPCQDLSVAGKRAGLAGERSGLFMEQIRIIKEMRERDRNDGRTDTDVFPRFMVWENVPGAFSSNGGEDFRAVLEETARVAEAGITIPRYEGGRWTKAGAIIGDRWSVSWRTHDAQYWGVPQRRRRISLVADFGGESAPEILFESQGLRGDPAESGEEGEGIAGDIEQGVKGADLYNGTVTGDIAVTLNANSGESANHARRTVMAFSQNGEGVTVESPVANALTTRQNPAGRGTAMIYGFQPQAGGNTGCAINKDKSPCLNVTQKPAVFDARGNGDGETAPTITGDHQNRITDYTAVCTYQNVSGMLNPGAHPGSYNGQDAYSDMLVTIPTTRRLTPLECERLQGYPDGWTDIGDWIDSRGKLSKTSDSARYKALGNSIALPFWYWLLRRIITHCQEKTMGSLFDGIGGFPLCWNAAGGETLWASEIEPFCISVTKKHFGDYETGEKGDWNEFFNR